VCNFWLKTGLQYGDQVDLHVVHITSKSFGKAEITYEIGKKENRDGDGDITTMEDFLKVHTLNYNCNNSGLTFYMLAVQRRRHLYGI